VHRYFDIVPVAHLLDVWLTIEGSCSARSSAWCSPGLGVRRRSTGAYVASSQAVLGSIVLIFIGSALLWR
jgi:hypothetical protein